MGQPAGAAFLLRLGSHQAEELTVSGFMGTEALSQPYAFQVDFHPSNDEPLEAESLPGAEALLSVEVRGGSPRHVHGMVRRVALLGQQGGRWRYRAWVVPKLWRLSLVKRSRIFQGKTVPQIVKAVLEEAGVEVKLSLSGSYEAREYCTQYRETDLAFISRLLEWEGIFYFFQHAEDGHLMVLGDGPNVHEALPGGATLPVKEKEGMAEEGEYLRTLERVHRLRPGVVHLKDYDFEKPELDVSGKAESEEGQGALEVYDYPGEYVAPGVGKQVAKVRMEEAVQAARTLNGEGVAPSLTAGYRFEVQDEGTHAGEYTVVEVVHSGRQPETTGGREALGGLYRCRFKCMPSKVPFRPRRRTEVPKVAGLQTATVVGPSGEEIHTDGHGRIKVQFHWDREGQRDDKASCWVRVGQAWGGPAWGALYLPRIGQEVLIRFLEGSPDRPLVAGTVYNGSNPTPYALPDEKTKSTLKSASTPGSDGFNEVRIEDAAGQEEVYLHAQKDEELITENDKSQGVGANEALLVKEDRSRTVEGNQRLDVALDDVSLVEGNQTLQVRGNRSTHIAGSHSEAVEGNQSIAVAKNFTATVSQAVSESVGAAKALNVGAGYSNSTSASTTQECSGPSCQTALHLSGVSSSVRSSASGWSRKVVSSFTFLVPGGRHELGASSALDEEES
ncbi:MAG TPA: type VI secretion system tip protein TssI/VgrG [Myxococcaceae bacterium]|nr:type VI secretion system tip protein TssI/VgrG [Myxococcaceae bacterium]